MSDKYMSVTVEYGYIEYDSEGNEIVFNDRTESFDSKESVASFTDMFDDLAFEVRNSLE